MRNSFDLLNDIFNWCVADEEMMKMLGVMDNTNTDVLKDKLRLECQADEAVTAAAVPFILCRCPAECRPAGQTVPTGFRRA